MAEGEDPTLRTPKPGPPGEWSTERTDPPDPVVPASPDEPAGKTLRYPPPLDRPPIPPPAPGSWAISGHDQDTNPPPVLHPDVVPPSPYTAPAAAYPPDSYPSTGYPPDVYPPSSNPPDVYPPSSNPPNAAYPPNSHPPASHPPASYPPANYPPAGSPPGAPDQAAGNAAPADPARAGRRARSGNPARSALSALVAGRHRRQTRIFLIGVGALVVIGLGSLAVFEGTLSWPFGGSAPSGPSAAPTCTAPAATVQAARSTRVRVYNASTRRGLAATVGKELQKRGFLVPEVPSNDPKKSHPTSAAVIRHGPTGLLAAHTVGTQIKGAVVYEADGRTDDSVDVVLGQSFALVDPAAGAAALKTQTPAPGCATSR
jgi:hypothetical protein